MDQKTSNKRLRLDCSDENVTIDPNKIAKICYDAYKKLGKSGKPNPIKNEFTVLGAIVEYNQPQLSQPKIICLSTGTKCFPKNISNRGQDIVDCHAEPLLKRAFKKYLIELLNDRLAKVEKPYPKDDFINEVFKDRNYCLFISQVPCGTFSRWEGHDKVQDSDSKNDLKTFKSVGINRKPGRGELCPKPGCIHKLAKWKIFGLQGSRLFEIIKKPIVFDQIIIGDCESPNFQFDYEVIKKRMIADAEECSAIQNEYKKFFNFVQPIQIHYANKFRHEEFIRNDIPCGSSIVAWQKFNSKNLQSEILANGRKLGAGKRKRTSSRNEFDCDPGSSKICDFHLKKSTDELIFQFDKTLDCKSITNDFQKIYQQSWMMARENLSIFQGWPIIEDK